MNSDLWSETGPGFSDDWLGFRRSVEKRASGRFYAQCKYCQTAMDGRLPNLRKHKLTCTEFGSSENPLATETYFESNEQVQVIVDDGDVQVDDESHHKEQILIKTEPLMDNKAKKRKSRTSCSPRAFIHHIDTPVARPVHQTPQPSTYSISAETPTGSKRSLFSDQLKVWESKLEGLPLVQALQIEKNINDMLFEAHLAHLQYSTPMINVNITTTNTDHVSADQ